MRVTDKYVYFWGEAPFTNFTSCPNLTYLGLEWKSTEQLFMWLKAVEFKDYQKAQEIRQTASPKAAKKLGRQVKNFDAEHWSKVSCDYMKKIVDIKFRSNPRFMKTLLNVAWLNKTFVEASPFDRVWGIGYDEKLAELNWNWGENRLGKILTELRDQYVKELQQVKLE